LLDENVLIVGLDHPKKHSILGIPDVIAFLQASNGTLETLFQPPAQVYGNNGYVIGVANWSAIDDPKSPILFSFVFVNRANFGDPPVWKIIRLWGTRPLGDLKA
jgi:hypothetical protein